VPGSTAGAETQTLRSPDSAIGPYAVEILIGKGGMGKVYRCYDASLRRRVAIKVLHEKYGADERQKARFRREAQVLASFVHPAVAQIYAIDTMNDGALYIVMEYVEGQSLDAILEREGALSPSRALDLVRQTAQGLRAAHERGIIHRDVKPSNLLVTPEGAVKVVDFGLAKELDAKSSLTDEGIVLGTPHYISPEQGRGLKVDQRSDIYSLGATLYHMVTGRPPFDNASQIAVILAHVQEDPPAPHLVRKDLPPAISRVIGRMMARQPEHRYSDYDELLGDIESLASGRRPSAATRAGRVGRGGRFSGRKLWLSTRWLGAAALLAALAAVVIWIRSDGPESELRADLGSWFVPGAGGASTLKYDFSSPPADVPEALSHTFHLPAPTRGDETAPKLTRDALEWTNYRQPLVSLHVFERIDEVRCQVLELSSSADLALLVAHPDGSSVRELALRLRQREETLEPLLALRRNEPVPLRPSPRAAPPLQAPFQLSLTFVPRKGSVQIELSISSLQASRPGALHRQTLELPGEDWARGVVLLRTDSPLAGEPFRCRLGKLVISGIPSGGRTGEAAWQS
jgi:serine/threonine protein kinase